MFPGDALILQGNYVRLGPGLYQSNDSVISTTVGTLHHGANNAKLSILATGAKRYLPIIDDCVIGTVVDKSQDWYRVDIGAPEPAMLPALAFEGASKRNKPNIELNTLVYARVARTDRDMEAELTCVDKHSKKDWMTGQTTFGELSGGLTVATTLSFAQSLLTPATDSSPVLEECGRFVPYEVCIGVNGRIWINSGSRIATILIANAIVNAQHLTRAQTVAMVSAIMQTIQPSS